VTDPLPTIMNTLLRARLRATRAALVLVTLVAGCSSAPEKPRPAELPANVALIGVRQAWSARVGEVRFPLQIAVREGRVFVAASDGTVAALDSASGRDVWRSSVGAPVAAGVGSDGEVAAVVTTANEVVAVGGGGVLWRQRLPAQVFTSPLVAGGRVFVVAADRTVSAWDARTGRRLWTQQRPGDPLVLRQAGVLMAVGDTLVVGQSGRLVGLNPNNGSVRWEAPIATPRGTNEVERLVDLVAGTSRVGQVVCARAFQAAVGCVDVQRGEPIWSQPARGAVGVHGDDAVVVGVESDSRLVAWRRDNGERLWTSDRLRYRDLSAPLALGRSVAVGDASGFVHLVGRDDGAPLNRLTTDGSAIVAQPVLAGQVLVAVTAAGNLFGWLPQ